LIINEEKIRQDLELNWIVVSEAIQTVLRREGIEKPYEMLRDLTRKENIGTSVTQESMNSFISSLNVSDKLKKELMEITPFNFIGIIPERKFH